MVKAFSPILAIDNEDIKGNIGHRKIFSRSFGGFKSEVQRLGELTDES
jgi:hypothetical protein